MADNKVKNDENEVTKENSTEKKDIEDSEEESNKSKKSIGLDKSSKTIKHELQMTVDCIAKIQEQIKKQERKYSKWEESFRKEIPELIQTELTKKMTIEIEKKVMEMKNEYLDDRSSNASGGTKKKIRTAEDIENEDERNIVQKAIEECIRAEKKKKAKEEEIKKKYQRLIQTEVRNALEGQTYNDTSSTSDEDLESDNNYRLRKKALNKYGVSYKLDRTYRSSSRGPQYSASDAYSDYPPLGATKHTKKSAYELGFP